jgi:long-subunit fatty acid transport protein
MLLSHISFSQYSGLGSWNIFNIKYTLDDKWSLFGEAQIRSLKFYNFFHYHEYKGGINYKFHPNARLSLGAGKFDTYKGGGNFRLPKNNDEFRIWPQLVLNQKLWKFAIEQRLRTEFRFTSQGYRNRFRYRVGVSHPLGRGKNGYSPFQIGASNELFFTDKAPYFERNRLLLTLDYKASKMLSFQAGYLHQFDYKINDESGRDFLLAGIFLELNRNKKQNLKKDFEMKED